MKLYIKQKVFSIGERFTVKDEFGNDRYFVEGEWLSRSFAFGIEILFFHARLSDHPKRRSRGRDRQGIFLFPPEISH